MDRDLLGDRRWHSPPASSSCFKSARSVSSRGILERICIRYPLGEMHQIQVVRREMIKNGKPQPGISATRHSSFRIVLLSLNVFLLPLLETSTLLSKASLSLSPSPRPPPPPLPSIYNLFVPIQRLPACGFRVTSHLVRF